MTGESRRTWLSLTAAIALAAAAAAPGHAMGGGPQQLQEGVPVLISGNEDDQLFFTIDVPPGSFNLEISIAGGFGDADLYVRFGQPPTFTQWDCRPFDVGNFEECSFASPQAGTWHVMVHGFAFFSNVTLLATWETATPLTPGTPVTISGASGSQRFFTLQVPAFATNLVISISGGTGDADLYVRFGQPPTTSSWDCRPFLNGNNESCTFASPQAGTWWVMIRGFASYSNVNLVGNFNTGTVPLANGAAVTALDGAAGTDRFFSLVVPAGAVELSFVAVGGEGNVELKVRRGSLPTNGAFDCQSTMGLRLGSCVFLQPQSGTYFVRLRGNSAYSGVTLVGRFLAAPPGPVGPHELNSGSGP